MFFKIRVFVFTIYIIYVFTMIFLFLSLGSYHLNGAYILKIYMHKRGSEQINRSLTSVRVAVEWSISKGSKTTTNQAHH